MSESIPRTEDESAGTLLFHHGNNLSGSTPSMADNVDITAKPLLAAELVAQDISALLRIHAEDDDATSQASSSTDFFDQSLESSSTGEGKGKANWKIDIQGNWERDVSLESATSTDITSQYSPSVLGDKTTHSSLQRSPSVKRMWDGSIKPTSIRLNSNSERPTQASTTSHSKMHNEARAQQPSLPPRRGRPPKDKSMQSGPTSRPRRASTISKLANEVRPRSSIPARLPVNVFASQCIEAAYASRLNPYALHPGEHTLLMNLLMNTEITVYLNIRNTILRLWHQNPLCSVTAEEAAGCAKEVRFFGLAEVAYKWLVRNGYINFGCVQVPRDSSLSKRQAKTHAKQRTVVIIGAGVSGLTAARQLEGLFAQDSTKWTDAGERPPRVIVLEGRRRVGGRVYSRPLRNQSSSTLPSSSRNTAEMGAMIVTGFEHGNPLDTVIRGQLGLRYHLMKDALTIYDSDGRPIDERRDMLNTDLYTDISDRTGEFRAPPQELTTLRGDEDLINRCRDPASDGFENFQVEPLFDPLDTIRQHKPAMRRGRRRNAPPGTEKLTGRSQIVEGSNATHSAARAAKTMGWELREGVAKNQSISLRSIANAVSHPTLGSVMDEAIEQYQDLIQLTPQDMRLLNWHHANLEYANAAPVSSLSLSGHDQDTGNEFEGAHSEIIGGYAQLPVGLMNVPSKLDVRLDKAVESIHYSQNPMNESDSTSKIVCTNGEVIEADEVVLTVPLGVLKSNMVDFDPPLPAWKRDAIDRVGFGLLNKVILTYDEAFWDDSRDMFGLLNEEQYKGSLDPRHYEKRRGKFYLIWNASKISGRPMLVALMAGHAAYEAENTDSATLMKDIIARLMKVFPTKGREICQPREVIVTRWKRDVFTRGTYSYVGPETRTGDYDLMAQSVGNLHFAGEATCGTHPATVHGAFLSGLRVAAEVMGAMAGPINLPMPLVGPAPVKQSIPARWPVAHGVPPQTPTAFHGNLMNITAEAFTPINNGEEYIKQEPDTIAVAHVPRPPPPVTVWQKYAGPPRQSVCAGDESFWVQPSLGAGGDLDYEAAIVGTILSKIGERPVKPSRPGVNPFLLYTKEKWDECKAYCAKHHPPGREDIRGTLGKWWKGMSEDDKRVYMEQSERAQEMANAVRKEWEEKVAQWDREAVEIRREYAREHPPPPPSAVSGGGQDGVGISKRKTNVSNGVVLDNMQVA